MKTIEIVWQANGKPVCKRVNVSTIREVADRQVKSVLRSCPKDAKVKGNR